MAQALGMGASDLPKTPQVLKFQSWTKLRTKFICSPHVCGGGRAGKLGAAALHCPTLAELVIVGL